MSNWVIKETCQAGTAVPPEAAAQKVPGLHVNTTKQGGDHFTVQGAQICCQQELPLPGKSFAAMEHEGQNPRASTQHPAARWPELCQCHAGSSGSAPAPAFSPVLSLAELSHNPASAAQNRKTESCSKNEGLQNSPATVQAGSESRPYHGVATALRLPQPGQRPPGGSASLRGPEESRSRQEGKSGTRGGRLRSVGAARWVDSALSASWLRPIGQETALACLPASPSTFPSAAGAAARSLLPCSSQQMLLEPLLRAAPGHAQHCLDPCAGHAVPG